MRENAWKRERKDNVVKENVRKESVDFMFGCKSKEGSNYASEPFLSIPARLAG